MFQNTRVPGMAAAGHPRPGTSIRRWACLATGAVACLLPVTVWATSSGLNNIPTADTTDDTTLVLQNYETLGPGQLPDYSAGFKLGLTPWDQRFEVGADGHLAPNDPGPLVLQGKYAVQPWEKWPTFCLGVANIAVTDRDKAGDPFSYAVASCDVNRWFRLHGGYGFQTDNSTPLLGIDSTFRVFNRNLMVCVDAIQIQNQRQWMPSFGFKYFFHRNWALETWTNLPLDQGRPSVVLKLNFILPFGQEKQP